MKVISIQLFVIHQSSRIRLWTAIWDSWSGTVLQKWSHTFSMCLIMTRQFKVELHLRGNSRKMTLCWVWSMRVSSSEGGTELSQEHGARAGRVGGWILVPIGEMSMFWGPGLRQGSWRRQWLTFLRSSRINANECFGKTLRKGILNLDAILVHLLKP